MIKYSYIVQLHFIIDTLCHTLQAYRVYLPTFRASGGYILVFFFLLINKYYCGIVIDRIY